MQNTQYTKHDLESGKCTVLDYINQTVSGSEVFQQKTSRGNSPVASAASEQTDRNAHSDRETEKAKFQVMLVSWLSHISALLLFFGGVLLTLFFFLNEYNAYTARLNVAESERLRFHTINRENRERFYILTQDVVQLQRVKAIYDKAKPDFIEKKTLKTHFFKITPALFEKQSQILGAINGILSSSGDRRMKVQILPDSSQISVIAGDRELDEIKKILSQ